MNQLNLSNKELLAKTKEIRDRVIEVTVRNKAGHIAPSLSCVDILVALYYKVMNFKLNDPLYASRDRLVFSKAHGCYALYAILADLNFIPKQQWNNFYTKLSSLKGCIERNPAIGIEASCGSLGHGLPMATGIAYGAKLQKKEYRIFCLIGDGEMQEGTTWESIQFAVKHNLDNLVIIIDSNNLQAMDFIVNVLDKNQNDKFKRLTGFGIRPVACWGHNAVALAQAINTCRHSKTAAPKTVVANTTKGFGLKCMENIAKFHFRIPTEDELCFGKSYD